MLNLLEFRPSNVFGFKDICIESYHKIKNLKNKQLKYQVIMNDSIGLRNRPQVNIMFNNMINPYGI